MQILADTHVHLYPEFDLGRVFACSLSRLATSGLPAGSGVILCLTEKAGFRFSGTLAGAQGGAEGVTCSATRDGGWSMALPGEAPEIWIIPGRQIITQERLELLALATQADIPDGLPVRAGIARVSEAGGIPVLPWSPGKWFSLRGRVVREVLEETSPDQLLIGDSALRPLGWGEPRLMRHARQMGFRVLAGTDPLPLSGDEDTVASYVTLLEGAFRPDAPLESFRDLVRRGVKGLAGQRNGPLVFARRYLANWRRRKTSR